MHCLYDLGRYTDAVRYADQALDLPSGSVRALALHQILLARVQAGMGEIEQSCETARSALHATVQLRSRRLRDRIGEYSSGWPATSASMLPRSGLTRSARCWWRREPTSARVMIEIRDFQTAGVVSFARGCPFYEQKPGPMEIMGKRVGVESEYLENCVNSVQELVNAL